MALNIATKSDKEMNWPEEISEEEEPPDAHISTDFSAQLQLFVFEVSDNVNGASKNKTFFKSGIKLSILFYQRNHLTNKK